MVSANGNTPIIFLSDAAEPRCIRKELQSGRRPHLIMPPCSLLPVPLGPCDVAPNPPALNPAFGTGQVADYGRLRWASIQPRKMNCQSLRSRGSAPPDPGPRPGKPALEHQPASPEEFPAPRRQLRAPRPAIHQAIDRGSPGALAHAGGAPLRHLADQRLPGSRERRCRLAVAANQAPVIRWTSDSACAEARRCRPRPAREGAASARDGRPAPPHPRAAAGAGRRPPPPPRRSAPGCPCGTATTQRQLSGTANRPISGATPSSPGRRPPSTMKPPRANAQVPIAERWPRETARASADGFGRETVELCQGAGHGKPQLGSGAQPAVRRDRPVHQRHGRPRARRECARKRRANSAARSASGPSAVIPVA